MPDTNNEILENENLVLSNTANSISNAEEGYIVMKCAIKIGIFACICKLWDNLTMKVQNPFLLSREWLISLIVFCALLSITRIFDTLKSIKDNYQLIKRDPKILKVFLSLNLIYISIYLIPTIILLLYLTNFIKPEVLEKTIKIFMWVYTATWIPIVTLVLAFLLAPLLTFFVNIPQIAKVISKLGYIGNALLNIKYKEELSLEEYDKKGKQKNNITGISPIDKDDRIGMKKTNIKGIIRYDFDCEDLCTHNLQDGMKKLEIIFNLLVKGKTNIEYNTSQTFQKYFAKCNDNLQGIFIDSIFEILEGSKTKEDGRTENDDKVTRIFYLFLKKCKEKNFNNIDEIEEPNPEETEEDRILRIKTFNDLYNTILVDKIMPVEERETTKTHLKSIIVGGLEIKNSKIPPNKRLYLDKLDHKIIFDCNFPEMVFPYLYHN